MSRARRVGTTLVEVLVVVGILAILIGLLLPAVQKVRDAATRVQCGNNLRQIGLACLQYHDAVGRFPPPEAKRAYEPSWLGLMLPYLDQQPLYDQMTADFRVQADPLAPLRNRAASVVVKSFVCAADGRLNTPQTGPDGVTAAFTSYVATLPAEGSQKRSVIWFIGARMADITDGASNTTLTGERPPRDRYDLGRWLSLPNDVPNGFYANTWLPVVFSTDAICNPAYSTAVRFGPGRPDNLCDATHFWSFHAAGGHFGFADGAVRFLPYSARDILPALATCDGGEPVSLP